MATRARISVWPLPQSQGSTQPKQDSVVLKGGSSQRDLSPFLEQLSRNTNVKCRSNTNRLTTRSFLRKKCPILSRLISILPSINPSPASSMLMNLNLITVPLRSGTQHELTIQNKRSQKIRKAHFQRLFRAKKENPTRADSQRNELKSSQRRTQMSRKTLKSGKTKRKMWYPLHYSVTICFLKIKQQPQVWDNFPLHTAQTIRSQIR